MLTPSEVLALAAAESITVEARGDLVMLTPPRRASPALREALRQQKPAVLALLADGGRSPPNGNGDHSYDTESETEEDAPTPERPSRRRRNTFTAPNVLRRFLLHTESGLGNAELRVYLFLVGQTMGWGKETDSISYAQIREGIRRRNGEVWCTGTGLAERTVIRAVQALVDRKLITCSKHNDSIHGDVANIYTLILDDIPEAPL